MNNISKILIFFLMLAYTNTTFCQCNFSVLPDTINTICYKDSLNLSVSSDSSLTYSWISPHVSSSVGDSVNFYSSNSGTYYVYVVGTDSVSCYDTIKIEVIVLDSLVPGNLNSIVSLCNYADSIIINFSQAPSGGGTYTYNWLYSNNGISFNSIPNSNNPYLNINPVDTSLSYAVEVTSNLSCGIDTTNILNIDYFAPFIIGSIYGADTLCRYYTADTIYQNIYVSGGDTNSYSFQWLNSLDAINWNAIAGANNDILIPTGMFYNTYFSLVVSNQCGTDTTNNVFDTIIPSPEYIAINGDSLFCNNQHDIFQWINETLSDISYSWNLSGGTIFQQISDSALALNLDNTQGNSVLELMMIHNQTGCQVQVTKNLSRSNYSSPNKTQIIRKPNSDILVCNDSSININYQWGFTNKSTNLDTDIANANLRYVLLPHTFDSVTYRYWVKTWFNYSASQVCETISYLGDSPITSISTSLNDYFFKPYPNPSTGMFVVPFKESYVYYLSNSVGQIVNVKLEANIINISHLPSGLYFLTILDKNKQYKFILNKLTL